MRKVFRRTIISYPLHVRIKGGGGVRNVSYPENLMYVLNERFHKKNWKTCLVP